MNYFVKLPKRGGWSAVDLSKVREFLQNDRDSHDLDRPPGRSDGRE
jgi:hypothetical protein